MQICRLQILYEFFFLFLLLTRKLFYKAVTKISVSFKVCSMHFYSFVPQCRFHFPPERKTSKASSEIANLDSLFFCAKKRKGCFIGEDCLHKE